ncbi:unnamed protein product [Phytophthora fragariaefolia]|uniref:Unnamed protein product n=1 Tax=Phytophthora fragariaefolia TaxID=1490495 RepID=A0A9W7D9L3_9STRA|nr:unnamed protein product [Phytophthora fragariaefolia]
MGRKLNTDSDLDYLGQDLAAYTAGVKERFYANAKLHLEAAEYTKSASQIKTKLGELESSYKAYKLSSALYRADASKKSATASREPSRTIGLSQSVV